MSDRLQQEQIQYIEFLSSDLAAVKAFYQAAFNWEFTDYGPEYTSFTGTYVDGGFAVGTPVRGSILPILYSNTLEATKGKVESAGGTINKDIFSFPGGRRFHFIDPDGNEVAVWSDV